MDPIQYLYQQAGKNVKAFPSDSRYSEIETKSMINEAGREIVFIKRRFLPQPGQFTVLKTHTVQEGERLDNISHQHLGDPAQFWRICDANGTLKPDELTESPGDKIEITLPKGITE